MHFCIRRYLFYLAFINYVSKYDFAPLAILLISISESIPSYIGIFTGSLADFQTQRVKKILCISFAKIILYSIVTLILMESNFSIISVALICLLNLISDSISSFSGSMYMPIYVKVIKENMNEAIGFSQALNRIVGFLGNFLGGVLILYFSVEYISAINVLTFVFSFVVFLLIRKRLVLLENEMTIDKKLSVKNYGLHIFESIKKFLSFKDIVKVLFASSMDNAVINTVMSISVLILIKNPFLDLQTGQSLALLTLGYMLTSIIGNLLSSKLFASIPMKTFIFITQLLAILVIVGYFIYSFELILIAVFLCTFINGLTSPRIRTHLFTKIPEESMGAVSQAISLVDLVVPSVLTIVSVFLATSISIPVACIFMIAILLVAFILNFSNKFTW